MRLLRVVPLLFLCFNFFQASAQDLCANAVALCANDLQNFTTLGGNPEPGDPVLPCGDGTVERSIWFTVQGINAGTAVIDLTNIDNNPGLSISAYTGTCGALVPIPGACNSANGPGGSTSISFATTAGTTYYIMVDGEAGNQETFTIMASTPDNGIIATPSVSFTRNPISGCMPLAVNLHNLTVPHGTPVTYEWQLCSLCPALPATGSDTTVNFPSQGTYSIYLTATNTCGPSTLFLPVYVQNLVPVINYTPSISCVGQPINFSGSATVQPDPPPNPPFVNPNITSWFWNFGDPGSGPSNTSTLQNPIHVFVGTPPFTVTLIVGGLCGPDTSTILVTLLPPPVVTATAGSPACQLAPVSLTSVVDSATAPISYQWSGPGTITCDTCQNTTATGLAPGGPYIFTVTITDANGCTGTDTASVFINPLPVANAGNDTTVCHNSPVTLNGTASGGTPPYTYAWTPSFNLSDSTLANPVAIVTMDTTYCLVVTDSFGCVSAPDCVDLNMFPRPTVNSPPSLCATDPAPLQSTFTVSGAGAGSTYNWTTSPDFSFITSYNSDSSSMTATYPSVAASYSFIVIVTDGVTGCVDTIPVSFSINPGLSMTLTAPDTICSGNSVNLTATGATTYAWTASPPYAFADSTLASQTVSPAATTTFTVLGKTGTCTQTLSTTITINPTPVAVAAPIPNFCGCMAVSLNGTGSTTPGMSYHWSSAGGNPITSPDSLVTTANICSSDVFTFIVTDPVTGCADTTTTSATSIPKPPAVAAVTPDTICNGVPTMVNLNGTGSDTNPGTTYLWTSAPPVAIANDTLISTTATVTTTTTFTLTVTAASGCDSVVTVTVQIHPPAVLSGSPGALCTTDPLLQSTLSISGASPGSTYNWILIPPCAVPNVVGNVSSQLFSLAGCGPGNFTFTVIVTDPVTTCIDTISTTIPIVLGVTLSTSNDTTICQSGTASLTASGATTYAWTAVPPYSFADSTLASQNVSPAATTTFIVTGATGTCTDTDTIIVTVNPPPTASASASNDTMCVGDTVTLTGNATNGTILWTTSGSGTFSNSTIPSPTYTAAAGDAPVVTLTMTVSNPPCANAVATVQITVLPLPVTSPITGPITICDSTSAVYSVTNNPSSYYIWTVTGGIITSPNDSSNSITVDWGAAGIGTVTVTEHNAFGCPGTPQTINVTINPSPVPINITGPTILCEDSIGHYIVTPSTPGSTYTWTVTGGIVASPGSSATDITWTPGTQTIIVTETNSFGCPGVADTLTVIIHPIPPPPVITGQDTVCQNDMVVYSVPNIPGYTYNWGVTGGVYTQNGDTLTVTWGAPPSGTITVSQTDAVTGCTSITVALTVVINPVPAPQPISGSILMCEGDAGIVYYITANPGSYYLWSVTGGIITSPPDSTQPNVTVSWPTAGGGTVTVTEVNALGCRTTNVISVSINAKPTASATVQQDTICAGVADTLIGVALNGNVFWQTTGTGTFGNSNMASTWYTPGVTDTGTTVLSMIVINAPCPNDTAFVSIYITPAPLVTVSTASSPADTVCLGNNITITATGGGVYSWTPGGATTDSIVVSPPDTAMYTVTVTNGFGCSTTASIIINVIHPGTADAGGSMVICNTDSAALSGIILYAGGGVWTTSGDGTFVPDALTLSAVYAPGPADIAAGTVTLVLTSTGNPCINLSDSITVTLDSFITVNAGPDQIVYRNHDATISGTVTGTPAGWWTTSGSGTFVPDSTFLNATYQPSQNDYNSGFIYLHLRAANACGTAIDSLRLDFPDIIVPNIFTPNADGSNDFFEIRGLPAHSKMQVFNRWGMLVFKADNYHNNWDAAELNDDTYYYIINTPAPENKSYHGYVRVVKSNNIKN